MMGDSKHDDVFSRVFIQALQITKYMGNMSSFNLQKSPDLRIFIIERRISIDNTIGKSILPNSGKERAII